MDLRPTLPLTAFLLTVFALQAQASPVSFTRDIRPVMADTCFHCHGPDAASRKAGLRLDIREEALKPAKSGAVPIVPGKPEESEVVRRLFTDNADDVMPPAGEHKTLTAEQRETFRRWIAEGATYETHWAYRPLERPAPPSVQDRAWTRNPVDAFILAELEKRGARPSPEADRRTLVRRVSLDLTGLPPSPEETEAFVNDTAPDAYDRLVDRLLASPRFGERMAVYWLDLARFADTAGYHGDQNLRIFPYRDYVIDSFNANKPFDVFTREQLAGDLLPSPTEEQLIATGFNRLNMMTREGGSQPKEYLAKYAADRVRTVGNAWLGSTFGCAECHDHKFDPITARDFYSMEAFFADITQWGVYADYGYTPEPELEGVNNDSPFPPEVEVTSPFLLRKAERLRRELDAWIKAVAARRDADPAAREEYTRWLRDGAAFLAAHPDGWRTVAGPEAGEDGVATFADAKASDVALKLPLAAGETLAAIRVELLPAGKDGSILRGGAKGRGEFHFSFGLLRKGKGKPEPLAMDFADAVGKEPRYANGAEIPGILTGWRTPKDAWNRRHAGHWRLKQPVVAGEGDTLVVTAKQSRAAALRVGVSPFARPEDVATVWMSGVLREAARNPRPGFWPMLDEAWLGGSPGVKEEDRAVWRRLSAEIRECRNGRTFTLVTRAREPYPIRVLPRGNWLDESGPITPPATPGFLPGPSAPEEGRLTRLDLANWLCAPENPLTARAFANRVWRLFFGTGISAVVDDLGAQGEPPSHPELLDWLAAEFRDSGWNVKRLLRLIVTSATYRQESNRRLDLIDVDPDNRLLAAQNARRLDAEFVRDNALAVAGVLNLEPGGPSIRPWQPPGYYANLQFPDRDYYPSTGGDQWRRGVYMHWQRTFLHPMLANFDAPMRDECTAARTVSNTPQQALTLLNDPVFLDAARFFAADLLKERAGDEARLQTAARRALARPLKPEEARSLLEFLNAQRRQFREKPEDAAKFTKPQTDDNLRVSADPAEHAAWTAVCRVFLNLHETVTRY